MLPFKKWSPEHSTEVPFEDNLNQVKLEELPLFKFEKLAIATDEFNWTNKLGQGGFGPVYKVIMIAHADLEVVLSTSEIIWCLF